MSASPDWLSAAAILIAAFALSLSGIALLTRLLPPGFLAAGINHRSAHTQPARQIGGLAVVPATICTILAATMMTGLPGDGLFRLLAAITILFVLGALDDKRDLGALTKLTAQLIAAAIAASGLQVETGLLALLPDPLAFLLAVAVLVGFVNLVNFMDGMDLMTVAGAGTGLFFLALVLVTGGAAAPAIVGFAFAGGLLGFSIHNRPQASVFLGDSGSLPIGLAAGYLILSAAEPAILPAAFLPFGYYLVDGSLTVLRRARAGENLLRAHSSHAYQHARRTGMSAWRIAAAVTATGTVTGTLAWLSLGREWPTALGYAALGWLAALALYLRLRSRS